MIYYDPILPTPYVTNPETGFEVPNLGGYNILSTIKALPLSDAIFKIFWWMPEKYCGFMVLLLYLVILFLLLRLIKVVLDALPLV